MKSRTPESRSRRLLWANQFAVLPGDEGGTRHFELSRILNTRGWDVTVAASDFSYKTRRFTRREHAEDRSVIVEDLDGVEFRWLWSSVYQKNNWRRAVNWITFMRSLYRDSLSLRPEIVIGSSPHLFTALAAERLATRMQIPFVFEVRDLWPESLLAVGGRKGPMYYGLKGVANWLYRRADQIVVLADGTRTYLLQRGLDADRIVFVPNGTRIADQSVVRKQNSKQFVLIYAGAHGPANGLDVVVEAAHKLRETQGIKFRLVGDGPSKAMLVARAKQLGLENLEFRDPVPKNQVPRLLADADAGLMVLREAPLFGFGVSPNKLFDYFGAGLPVVCNVPGEVSGWLATAGAGEQADNSSSEALARAVLRLARREPTEREAMGRAGRQWAAQHHDWTVLGDRLDSALRKMVIP